MIAQFLLVLAAAIPGQNESPKSLTEDDLKRDGGVALTFEMVEPTKATPEDVVAAVKRRLGWFKAVGGKAKGKVIEVFVPPKDEFFNYETDAAYTLTRSNVELALRLLADRRKHPREFELAERLWPKESAKKQRFVTDAAKTIAEFTPYGRWQPATDPAAIERGRSLDWTMTPRQMGLDEKHRFVSSALIAKDDLNDEEKTERLTRDADGKTWVLAKFESDIILHDLNNLTRQDENGERYMLLVYSENDLGEKDIAKAKVDISDEGEPQVVVRFTKEGAHKIERLTSKALAKFQRPVNADLKPGDDFEKLLAAEMDRYPERPQLAIVVNERVTTAPTLHTTISEEAVISTRAKAYEARIIASGLSPESRLPCRLRLIETRKFAPPTKKPSEGDRKRNR